MKKVNLETITDTQSWYRKAESHFFNDTYSLKFGKHCEDLSWNHRTSTPHRSETNGIAERAVRGIKDRKSAVLFAIWLGRKNGGLILWNAVAIFEMFKTSWQTEKLRVNGNLENHLKSQSVIPFGAMCGEVRVEKER